jgi:hypothetical protein
MKAVEIEAERQHFGLEPFPTDCKLTVGELVEWWLRERCPAASQEREKSRLRKNVITTPLGMVPVRHLTAARVDDHLHELERAGAAPASVNHVRAKLRTVFFKARKAGVWVGANPITETESRRVPKRMHPTLRIEEIPRVLEHVPALWRPFTATAIYTGLRKGELCGLRKSDVEVDVGLDHCTLLVRPRDDQGRPCGYDSHRARSRALSAGRVLCEYLGPCVSLGRRFDAVARVRS